MLMFKNVGRRRTLLFKWFTVRTVYWRSKVFSSGNTENINIKLSLRVFFPPSNFSNFSNQIIVEQLKNMSLSRDNSRARKHILLPVHPRYPLSVYNIRRRLQSICQTYNTVYCRTRSRILTAA